MKYIASCSFGKDSLASILLAIENSEPLDAVVWCEVMFSHKDNISAEVPEHAEWIYGTAIPKLRQMGLRVDVVKSKEDYVSFFSHKITKGPREGKFRGFTLAGKCTVGRDLKMKVLRDYYKGVGEDVVQYVGIAADEPKRLARLEGSKVSLLAKYGYTEEMAKEKCRDYGLLSPLYDGRTRSGCWFCPDCRYETFARFRSEHPDLWQKLRDLGKTPNLCSYGFKYGKTVEEVDEKLTKMIEEGRIGW